MQGRIFYLRVGLLLVFGLAAATGLVWFLGANDVRHGHPYESYFRESVQGLDVGAPVKFRGVTLGQVTQIALASALYLSEGPADMRRSAASQVVVRYVIDAARVGRLPDVQTATAAGLRARLAAQGLTGLAYLELDFVDPAQFPPQDVPWTPENPVIASMPSTITQVQDAAQSLLAKINAIDMAALGNAAQEVLADLHGQIGPGGDASKALADAAGMMADLRGAVAQADLPGLVADLRATSAALRATAQGPGTRELIASSARAADRLAEVANRLPALVSALEVTVRRTDGTRADLQSDLIPLLRDARAAAANLRETSETLRRYPSSVLLGAPPPPPEHGR
jgi:ABC-type transporter Mla subunit MlaD